MYKKSVVGVLVLVLFLASFSYADLDSLPDDHDESDLVYYSGYAKTNKGWPDNTKQTGGKIKFKDDLTDAEACEEPFLLEGYADTGLPFFDFSDVCQDGAINCCVSQLIKNLEGDKCSYGLHAPGTVFVSYDEKPTNIIDDLDWRGSYLPDELEGHKDDASFICDDKVWKECSEGNVNDVLEVLSLETLDQIPDDFSDESFVTRYYYCTEYEVGGTTRYEWIDSENDLIDADGDGVPNAVDCAPNDSTQFQSFPLGCSGGECIINATEICGDGIVNDCSLGITSPAEVEAIDSCVDNKIACEESNFAWQSLNKDGSKGVCCGASGLEDVGMIQKGEGTEYVCLSNEYASAGGKDFCEGEWCWAAADSDNFRVFTINKAEEAYDVVANGEEWVECANGVAGLPDDGILTEQANRFYCAQNAGVWEWSECLAQGAQEASSKNAGTTKVREAGDGTYKLFPIDVAAGSQKGPIIFDTIGPTTSVLINSQATAYTNLYGDDYLFDFGGYDTLNMMVRFDTLTYFPADVVLTVEGPEGEVLLEKNILGYATNNPSLKEGKWYHISVPISGFTNVEKLTLKSTSDTNKISVRNIHVSTATPLLCSGQSSSGTSSWIKDVDDVKPGTGISGENICNALYDSSNEAKAWLGEDELIPAENRCCGNTVSEYYAGPSENGVGCWNSVPIMAGETAMNVQFSVNGNTKTYACLSDSECTFPLEGKAPYSVVNSHTELYNLFFVTPEGDIPIGSNGVYQDLANIKVTNVPQQVVLVSNEDENHFYGCSPANYIENIGDVSSVEHCTIKENAFCSFSSMGSSGTIINSWSSDVLEYVGYDTAPDFFEGEYQAPSLKLYGGDAPRNQTSYVVPSRNFISNANFEASATLIPHWEFLEGTMTKKIIQDSVAQGVVTLNSNEILRSKRIIIPKNKELAVSFQGDATLKVILIDKNGNSKTVVPTAGKISSQEYTVMRLVFTGPGTVTRPMAVVAQGSNDLQEEFWYNTQTAEVLGNNNGRNGAACCPQDYCWNGYVCVEPMGESTHLAEILPTNESYRCVQGEWKPASEKIDWNKEEKGFCESQDQCLVANSKDGASFENNADDFYEGAYPTCIDSGEFVFDNYCEEGEWSSRTKFLAEELLDFADQNNDFVLHCGPFEDMLLNFDGRENILFGDSFVTVSANSFLDQQGGLTGSQLPVCFESVHDGGVGEKLVPASKNTCINNVCALISKEGDAKSTMFATSLNKPVDGTESFFLALDLSPENLASVCEEGEGFVECSFDAVDSTIFYSKELNSVIFGKKVEGSGLFEKIFNFFASIFSDKSNGASFEEFVIKAGDFREVYVLEHNGVSVSAVKTLLQGGAQRIVAEYVGFKTPICSYLSNLKLSHTTKSSGSLFSQESTVECSQEGNTYFVEVYSQEEATANFYWSELTGKLRVGTEE